MNLETLGELAQAATIYLKDFFGIKDPTKEQLQRAAIAQRIINSWTSVVKVQNDQTRLAFELSRQLADDKHQLAVYLKASMPNSPMVRSLPLPTERKEGGDEN